MSTTAFAAPSFAAPYSLDELEYDLVRSKTVARSVIFGLPALGVLASLLAELPLFAVLMAASFLLATALVCRNALVRFTSRTLRLLVAARLVIILVLGALLFCATGEAWAGIVSTLLLWLVADRLLGRFALNALGQVVRGRRSTGSLAAEGSSRTRPTPDRASLEGHRVAASDSGAADRLFSTAEEGSDPVASPRRRGRAKR